MFNTSLKNVIKSSTNDLLYHYIYPENKIETEYKRKSKKRSSK